MGNQTLGYLHQADEMYSKAIESMLVQDNTVQDKVALHQERAQTRYRLGMYTEALQDLAVAFHFSGAIQQEQDFELKRLAIECMVGAKQLDESNMGKVIAHLTDGNCQASELITMSLYDASNKSNWCINSF